MKFLRTMKGWNNRGLFLLTLVLVCLSANAQQRKDLEQKRMKLIKEISNTSKLLKKTSKDKKATYAQYLTLKNQIDKREELVNTFQKEIDFTNSSIIRSSSVIESLQVDVERLRAEYGKMARKAYHLKKTRNDLWFLLSARSFNETMKRWVYLRQYERYRKKQVRLILGTQQSLLGKIEGLEQRKSEKEQLLKDEESQKLLLEQELRVKDDLLKSLKKDEGRLKEALNKQRKERQSLNAAIEKVIWEDVGKTREAGRSYDGAKKELPSTPEVKELAASFRKNRGQLPWPVENGFISKRFGKQAHPLLKTLQIDNKGIDIQTSRGAIVKSIFGGKIISARMMRGGKYTVLMKHGVYYTVYSNLRTISVEEGETIQGEQTIGTVGTNAVTGQSEVHLEIRKGKKKLNPARWLRRG